MYLMLWESWPPGSSLKRMDGLLVLVPLMPLMGLPVELDSELLLPVDMACCLWAEDRIVFIGPVVRCRGDDGESVEWWRRWRGWSVYFVGWGCRWWVSEWVSRWVGWSVIGWVGGWTIEMKREARMVLLGRGSDAQKKRLLAFLESNKMSFCRHCDEHTRLRTYNSLRFSDARLSV